MPAIILHTSVAVSDDAKNELAKALSIICAEGIGKPEDYVLSLVNDGNAILFGGQVGKAAWVEVRSIGGLNQGINNKITKAVCDLLSNKLDIDPARVYLNFSDIAHSDWGWNSKTF